MKNKGVTLISLIITIIVLIIITGISITAGKTTIQKARLEELKTNMYLIQAKAKEYVEEANFRIGNNYEDLEKANSIRHDVYTDKAQLGEALTPSEIPDYVKGLEIDFNNPICYELTEEARKSWKLDKIEMEEDEQYIIVFDEGEEQVYVFNTIGFDGLHSLWEIEHYGSGEYDEDY